MSRRYIAIELEPQAIHLAVAQQGEEGPRLEQVRTLPCGDHEGQVDSLRSLQEELQPGLGEVVEVLLPASSGYARRLEYPFQNTRKLAAVVPPDFFSRLPVDSAELALAYSHYEAEAGQSRVAVAGVERSLLRQVVDLFDAAEMPLSRATPLPWCLADNSEEAGRSLLVWLREEEVGLALSDGGEIRGHALSPFPSQQVSELVTWLLRQAEVLERRDGWEGLPVTLFGSGPEGLRAGLEDAGRTVRDSGLSIDDLPVSAAQSRVAKLALAGAKARRPQGINFLQGEFSPAGGWQGLLRPLRYSLGLAALVLLLGLITIGSGYLRKAREADRLDARAVELLKTTFPEIRTVQDISLQMQSQMQQLRARSGEQHSGQLSALQLLRALSQSLPPDLDLVLNEWSLSNGEVRMEGSTTSFEDVNRLAELFGEIEGVQQASVVESKAGRENRVAFRLRLVLGDAS